MAAACYRGEAVATGPCVRYTFRVSAAPETRRPEVIQPIRWKDGVLHLLDQRKLPREETYLPCGDVA